MADVTWQHVALAGIACTAFCLYFGTMMTGRWPWQR
jgi:hypothetical protein